jgi:hypothetical protein
MGQTRLTSMTFRTFFITLAVLIALGAAWSKRQAIEAMLSPPPPPAKAIQFDNGTVRQYGTSSASSAQPQITAGGMRKCFKGGQVSYTNLECPPGATEKPVAGPPVNVLPAQAGAKPNEPSGAGKSKATLRDALDLERDGNLKDRMMERVIDGQK